MNIRNYRRRPNLAPDGNGQQDTPPLRQCQDETHGAAGSAPARFQAPSSPPESTSKDTSENGGCIRRCCVWLWGKGVLQASITRASGPWEVIPQPTVALRPWSGHDADAQPGTGSVTKGSASWCLLHFFTFAQHSSPPHMGFLKHRFDSSPPFLPGDHVCIA